MNSKLGNLVKKIQSKKIIYWWDSNARPSSWITAHLPLRLFGPACYPLLIIRHSGIPKTRVLRYRYSSQHYRQIVLLKHAFMKHYHPSGRPHSNPNRDLISLSSFHASVLKHRASRRVQPIWPNPDHHHIVLDHLLLEPPPMATNMSRIVSFEHATITSSPPLIHTHPQEVRMHSAEHPPPGWVQMKFMVLERVRLVASLPTTTTWCCISDSFTPFSPMGE